MAARVVRAIDQETANASGAHLCEGDLLLADDRWHAPLNRSCTARTIPLRMGAGAMAVHMIKLTETREITSYLWGHPDEDR
jgi:hypothetical protein